MKCMGLILFFLGILVSALAEAKLSASQVVEKIDRNEVSFQRGAILNLDGAVAEAMISLQKAKYPNFKPGMWYYNFFKIDNIGYYVFYDWTSSECNYTTMDLVEMEKGKGAPQLKEGPNKTIIDSNKETIPMRVCEKLYNFYSK